ncbi:MAG: universal stress protein [Actinomycetota bacterium]
MPGEETVVLIAFDGSPTARRAVHHASRFLTVDRAVVLTVWAPIDRGPAPPAYDLDGPPDPPAADEIDMALAEAQRTNADGVALAVAAGLPAEPMFAARTSTVWATIIAAADDVDADLIVTGTRAITGFRSLVQSSVADHVRRRGRRPVLIVPPEL